MKDIYELIRQREADVERIQRELEALRLSARLLEESDRASAAAPSGNNATTAHSSMQPKPQIAPVAPSSAWASAKQFP
jgi:hypothetical protein